MAEPAAGGIPAMRHPDPVLQQIEENIDSNQFETALDLCSIFIANQQPSAYAFALKARIMEMMGKPDEALNDAFKASEIIWSNNVSDRDLLLSLKTLLVVFKRLQKMDVITSYYEKATKKHPLNMELMTGLFCCHVMQNSYQNQYKTALQMYKAEPKIKYLLWVVCSVQLQVKYTDVPPKLLSLAESTVAKHKPVFHTDEELAAYVSILEQNKSYDAAVVILDEQAGALMKKHDRLRLEGRIFAKKGSYADACRKYQNVLKSCPDDWESFRRYLGCVLHYSLSTPSTDEPTCWCCNVDLTLWNTRSSLSNEQVRAGLASALSFIEKIQRKASDGCMKGPHLAKIEIERYHRLYSNPTDRKFIEAFINYFRRLGHLSSSSSHVEMYFHLLSDDEKTQLLSHLAFAASSVSEEKALGLTITTYKIQECFAKSTADLQSIAKRIIHTFFNLPPSSNLDHEKSMHSEELLSMTINILIQLFRRTRKLGYLLEAILVQEFGLTVRKHVRQYKITLVHVYSFLGALSLAKQWYASLEEKNIHVDYISHHILLQMLRSPYLEQTADLVGDYLRFLDNRLEESADLNWLPYINCTYSKVIESVERKNRLQLSREYIFVDSVILRLKQKADQFSELGSILESVENGNGLLHLSHIKNLKQLKFDEHLEAQPWWTPTAIVNFLSESNDEASSRACFRDKVWGDITRKCIVPRLIYCSIHGCVYHLRATRPSEADFDITARKNLEDYIGSIGYSISDALRLIFDLSSGDKSIKDFAPNIVNLMSFSVFANAMSLSCGITNFNESSSNSWQIVDRLLKICIEEQLTDSNQIPCPGNNLEVLVQMITEPIAWHIVIIQSCIKEAAQQGEPGPDMQAIHSSVQSLMETIKSIQRWLSGQMNQKEHESIFLSSLQGIGDEGPGVILRVMEENSAAHDPEVCGRIAQSLQELLAKLMEICAAKLKLLLLLPKCEEAEEDEREVAQLELEEAEEDEREVAPKAGVGGRTKPRGRKKSTLFYLGMNRSGISNIVPPPLKAWDTKPQITSETSNTTVSNDQEINHSVQLRSFLDGHSEDDGDMKYYASVVALMKLQKSTVFTIDFEHMLKPEYKDLAISIGQKGVENWVYETIVQFCAHYQYLIAPIVRLKNQPHGICLFDEFISGTDCYKLSSTSQQEILEATFHGRRSLALLIDAVIDMHTKELCFHGLLNLEDLIVMNQEKKLDSSDMKKVLILRQPSRSTDAGCKADMARIWHLCEQYYAVEKEGSPVLYPLDFDVLSHELTMVDLDKVRSVAYRRYIRHHTALSSCTATRNFTTALCRLIKIQGIRRQDEFLNLVPAGMWFEWEHPTHGRVTSFDWRDNIRIMKQYSNMIAGIYDYQVSKMKNQEKEGVSKRKKQDTENLDGGAEPPFNKKIHGMLTMKRNVSEHGYKYADEKDEQKIELFALQAFKYLVAFLLKKILQLGDNDRKKYTGLLNAYFAEFGIED